MRKALLASAAVVLFVALGARAQEPGAAAPAAAPAATAPAAGEAAAAPADWAELGAATFANCAGCHQAEGQGVPGAFPPLAGHSAELFAAEGGRAYLINVLLFGLQGPIEVDGAMYNGVMPAWAFLDDAAIAATINHIVAGLGDAAPADFAAVTAEEVAAMRPAALTPMDVLALRPDPAAAGAESAAPAEGAAPVTPGAPVGGATPVSFTADQATRGAAAYQTNCVDCHGPNLDDGEFGGPPLTGTSFSQRYLTGSPAALFAFMSTAMPPDRPGQLSDTVYAAITAYVLSRNGIEPGATELPHEATAIAAMTF